MSMTAGRFMCDVVINYIVCARPTQPIAHRQHFLAGPCYVVCGDICNENMSVEPSLARSRWNIKMLKICELLPACGPNFAKVLCTTLTGSAGL
jgi:hypothetical protein